MPKAPRTSKLARSAVVGVAVARAGMAQLTQSARRLVQPASAAELTDSAHDAALGRIAFQALNQLKGVALKASQLLSMDMGLLPEGIRQQLARAHYQVTPLNRALVLKLLRQEFRQSPEELFADFEPQAFAAASLGQVHDAKLHSGELVAVKLQYPGMAATIKSDLQLLRMLLKSLGSRAGGMPNSQLQERALADIANTLEQELDYIHEAAELKWFGQHLSSAQLVVPQPVLSHTTARVLTMQKLEGLHLETWLATHPSQAERDHYGQLLFDMFMHNTFVLKRLQTDPHPGNFLFMHNRQMGLLDFGCTRELDAVFATGIASAWCAVLATPRDNQSLQAVYARLGLIDVSLSEVQFHGDLLPALQAMQDWQCLPFRTAVYDFGQHPVPPRPTAQHHQVMKHLQAIPPDLPYFDRAHLGLINMLRTLGARVSTSNPWIYMR